MDANMAACDAQIQDSLASPPPNPSKTVSLWMRDCQVVFWVVGGLLLSGGVAWSQEFRGKFIGYVPAHERVQEAPVPEPEGPAFENDTFTMSESADDDSWMSPDDVCSPNDVCSPCNADAGCCFTLWGRAEYLLYWTKSTHVPALATTSPAGTARAQAGVLGRSTTTVLFGDDELHNDSRSGGRFTLGLWLDPCHSNSFDVTYFLLEDESTFFSASSSNFTILARPFFNTRTSAQDSRLIAFPSVVSGSLQALTSTELQGLEATLRYNTNQCDCVRTDLMLGYRFLELRDRIRLDESTLSLAAPAAGARIDLFDQFDTHNSFHGGQLGISSEWQCTPCWSWEGVAKAAIGQTTRRADLTGQTTTTFGGATSVTQAGLLVLPSNSGEFKDSEVGAVWEVGLTLRRDFHCGFSATVGYSGLLWNEVWRAGEQVDLNVNTSQIPPGTLTGAARPAFPADVERFWAQGIHFGIERSY